MFEVPSAGFELNAATAVALAAVGILTAFFGKTLWKVVVFLVGAVTAGGVAYAIANMIAPLIKQDPAMCSGVAAIVAGIIGGFLAIRMVKAILAAAVGGIFVWIVMAFTANALYGVIAFLAGFLITIMLIDRLMGVITGIIGGAMVGFAVAFFIGMPVAMPVVAAVVAIVGIYYQFKKHDGDMSRPEKDEDAGAKDAGKN